jgi:transcriptional regulator with XRE-family HTH domain
MDLADFMDMVGMGDEEVALEVGVSRPTISRIRRRLIAPAAGTLLRLNRWAETTRRRRGIPRRYRLTWGHLLRRRAA